MCCVRLFAVVKSESHSLQACRTPSCLLLNSTKKLYIKINIIIEKRLYEGSAISEIDVNLKYKYNSILQYWFYEISIKIFAAN